MHADQFSGRTGRKHAQVFSKRLEHETPIRPAKFQPRKEATPGLGGGVLVQFQDIAPSTEHELRDARNESRPIRTLYQEYTTLHTPSLSIGYDRLRKTQFVAIGILEVEVSLVPLSVPRRTVWRKVLG